MLGVVALQVVQRHKQQHAVLPAGDTHGNPVSLPDHAVIVHGAADKAGKLVQISVHAAPHGKFEKSKL